jgi:predicted DCC family thiol-disulfide oxidoreductase YuxK
VPNTKITPGPNNLTKAGRGQGDGPKVIYDGDCPFCSWYVDSLAMTSICRINARNQRELVQELALRSIDIDRDMVLVDGAQTYVGAAALHRLAWMDTERAGGLSGFHRLLFRRYQLAVVCYPFLRLLRNVYLKMFRLSSIKQSDHN